MLLELERTVYLGPARVAQVVGQRVQLEFPDQCVWALTALASPYQIVAGDTVLAIGQEEAWYVIGLLKGTGDSIFRAPADLKFHAPDGKIELLSGKGVSIQSTGVRVTADRIELVAQTIYEKFFTAWRWVRDVFQLRAGHVQTLVKETYRVKAGRIVERAEGDVHIDGRKIHLG